MCKPSQLIKLYCAVCHHYDNTLVALAQRNSNNFSPKFTDAECMTILIWGIYNQKFDVKRCHEYIVDYYGDWFPNLPGYEAFNKRVQFLADAFKVLASILLGELGIDEAHADFIYDSMPIMLAGSARSGRAKVAPELCSKGYCASKKMWYYGVKLHTIALSMFAARTRAKARPPSCGYVMQPQSHAHANIYANIQSICPRWSNCSRVA